MARFQVLSLDVWGNENDGFDVNQSFYTNHYIDIPDINNDADIIVELIDNGLLKSHATTDNIEIDGDDFMLYVSESKTGCPLFHLAPMLDED